MRYEDETMDSNPRGREAKPMPASRLYVGECRKAEKPSLRHSGKCQIRHTNRREQKLMQNRRFFRAH
jgi:hypothetical protein